jgi:hypothetical protein
MSMDAVSGGARNVLSGLAVLLLACGAARAAPLPRYGIFYFSSQCYEEESGDDAGNQAILLRTRDEDTLLWYWSEGPMMGPASAMRLHIDAKGNIAFTVDTGSQVGQDSNGVSSAGPPDLHSLKGRISASALVLGERPLPRVTHFAARIPVCR